MKIISIFTIVYVITSCSVVERVRSQSKDKSKERSNEDLTAYAIAKQPQAFTGCDGVQEYVRQILHKRNMASNVQPKSLPVGMDEGVSNANTESGSEQEMSDAAVIGTNTQEKNVDEADFSKISEKFIYVYTDPVIHVTGRKDLKYIGPLRLKDPSGVQLFTYKNHLLVLSRSNKKRTVCSSGQNKKCDSISDQVTQIDLYKEESGSLPKLTFSKAVIGNYSDARIANDRLILLAQNQLSLVPMESGSTRSSLSRGGDISEDLEMLGLSDFSNIEIEREEVVEVAKPNLPIVPEKPIILDEDGEAIWGTKCSRILRPSLPDTDFRMTKLVSLNLSDVAEEVEEVVVLGGGEQFYVSDRYAYIAKQGLQFNPWTSLETEELLIDSEFPISQSLVITKIQLANNEAKLKAISNGFAAGRVKNQWAFKELDDGKALVIATTENGNSNSLFVMKDKGDEFKITSSIRGYGKNETIRAIRYVGSMAYVVTFRRTDPLFAFDLSDLDDIKLDGELHIPGFSTYLHPAGQGRLIGVGYDADEATGAQRNVQVSLFDVSDSKNPERLDFDAVGEKAMYSEANDDHKAFFYDDKEKVFAVPFSNNMSIQRGVIEPTDSEFILASRKEGVAFFEIKDDKIIEIGSVEHRPHIKYICHVSSNRKLDRKSGIRRVFKIDGSYIAISHTEMQVLKPNSLALQKTVSFYGETCVE